MYRSSTSYFCGHYSFGPCVNQLINLICNMLGNMLNDLAEAIRRWTGKKGFTGPSLLVGYRCFRRRPGCLASVRGVFVAHCLPSSLCLMATKAFGPVWGSFPLHHASCVVGVLCAPSLRYSSSYDPWPLFGTPLRHVRTPSGACVSFLSLSSAASWLPLSSLLLCGLWCGVCCALAAPPFLLPPLMAGFLLVGCVLFASSVAWIPRLPLCIIALSFHPGYIGLIWQ